MEIDISRSSSPLLRHGIPASAGMEEVNGALGGRSPCLRTDSFAERQVGVAPVRVAKRGR